MSGERNIQLDWNEPTAYERWYTSSLGRAYAASLECILRPWLSQSAGKRVLDIGCGPGLAVEHLFPPDTEIVGLDCSEEMAQRALASSRQAGRPRQIVVGSVENIPFADESFDLAFCINCLEFVEHRDLAFQEIARILRPSGSAILGVMNRCSMWEFTRRIRRPFSRHSYYRGRFYGTGDVRDFCRKVGLQVEEVKTVVHFPPIPPGPLSGMYHRMDRWSQRHSLPCGGVILCRATKPSIHMKKTKRG